jgi:hypothetical protein
MMKSWVRWRQRRTLWMWDSLKCPYKNSSSRNVLEARQEWDSSAETKEEDSKPKCLWKGIDGNWVVASQKEMSSKSVSFFLLGKWGDTLMEKNQERLEENCWCQSKVGQSKEAESTGEREAWGPEPF